MTITYTTVTDPVYLDAAKTAIRCTVQFSHLNKTVQFVATPHDTELYGKALFAALVKGTYGPIAPFVAPAVVNREVYITPATLPTPAANLAAAGASFTKTALHPNK